MAQDPKRVAVVSGRNHNARDGIFDLLRALGLDPVAWDDAIHDLRKGAPHAREILDALLGTQAIVVLLTPDEQATLVDALKGGNKDDNRIRQQARPNVWIEAGMALGVNPQGTILVRFGDHDEPSDIHGLDYIAFDGSPQSRNRLKNRLETLECAVVARNNDWLRAGEGDFAKALATGSRAPLAEPNPSDMTFREPFYFAPGDGTPFCPRCWEADKRRIHLDEDWARTRWECPHCHHTKVLDRALPLKPEFLHHLSEPGVKHEAWLAQEARFKNLRGKISGIWQQSVGSSGVTWNITPTEGASMDDLRAFRAEAVLARNLLVKAGLVAAPSADAEDDWLNAVRVLTESETDLTLTRTGDGRTHGGRGIKDLGERSALACVRLAGGARPTF